VLAWLTTRARLESKRLPELLLSQLAALPGGAANLVPHGPLAEKDEMVIGLPGLAPRRRSGARGREPGREPKPGRRARAVRGPLRRERAARPLALPARPAPPGRHRPPGRRRRRLPAGPPSGPRAGAIGWRRPGPGPGRQRQGARRALAPERSPDPLGRGDPASLLGWLSATGFQIVGAAPDPQTDHHLILLGERGHAAPGSRLHQV